MTDELVIVERALESAHCAYCEEASDSTCRACSRAICREHRPSVSLGFCTPCALEWSRGTWGRMAVRTVAAAVSGAVSMGAVMIIAKATGWFSAGALGVIAVPILTVIATTKGLERLQRHRFKPTHLLPPATLRD